MSNTAEIIELDNRDGYEVNCQNTDGEVFVDSLVVEDDAFEHIESHVQEEGRTAYDAEEGYEFILEGEQLVGARVGHLKCVKEVVVEQYEVPYGQQKYNFSEMVEEFDIPDTQEAYDSMGMLPLLSLEVEWDKEVNETEVTGVKLDGKWYDLIER